MSIIITKSVNFGVIKSGLGNVGFRLLNSDGSVLQARLHTGITELVSGTGIYGGNLTLPVGISCVILWDSGDASPYYASENYDSRQYQGSGGGVAFMSAPKPQDPVFNAASKKKLFSNLRGLMEKVNQIDLKAEDIKENLSMEFLRLREGQLRMLLEKKVDLSALEQNIQSLKEDISNIPSETVDIESLELRFQEIKESIDSQKEFFEPLIDALTVLIETNQIKAFTKEIK